jgi:hypothetical protein
METYQNGANAVLSQIDGETTDNLIASAIKTLPKSAVAEVMPVVKTKGPTSQWVEPYYNTYDKTGKIELLSSPVSMYDISNTRKNMVFSSNAVEDLIRMYTPEAFNSTLHGWILFQKNSQQRDELVKVLQSPEVSGVPASATIPAIVNTTQEDVYEFIQDQVMRVIAEIEKDYQLGSVHFSVVGPYSIAYPMMRLKSHMNRIHYMCDDRLDRIYIFPTGDAAMSRAGLSIFEYADEVQKAIDSETGDLSYWVYNRSIIIVNPCHKRKPIIRNIIVS